MLQQPITPNHLIPNSQLLGLGRAQTLLEPWDLGLTQVQTSERPERRKSGAGVGGYEKVASPGGLGSETSTLANPHSYFPTILTM